MTSIFEDNNNVLGVQISYFGCGDPYGDNNPEENIVDLNSDF